MPTNMRALIDSANYFDWVRDYYRMFSHDIDFTGANILIEPRKISRFSTRSITGLLQALTQHGRNQEKEFVVVTHGTQTGLPIRIKPNNRATLQHTLMDALTDALSDQAATRTSGRRTAMLYQSPSGQRVFASEADLDALLALVQQVRRLHLRHLEFRGCNLGAGRGLRAIHRLLGAQCTVAPRVRHIAYRFATARQGTVSEARFLAAVQRLPAPRRTFTRAECFGGGTRTTSSDVVVAIAVSGNQNLQLLARDRASLTGWTQSYLQDLTLFAAGQQPAGGGYRAGGPLPIFSLETPNHAKPFVFPGDADYASFLTAELAPVSPAAFAIP